MISAYDYPLAKIIDEANIDIVLIGDSLANVVLGLESTRDVGMNEMIHHAKAARRGVTQALLIGDMPYEGYQADPSQAVANAKRFIDEAGCEAVKVEWFDQCLQVSQEIIAAGIPLMGHVGLTPQTAERLGGLKVQGKDAQSAQAIIEHAKALERIGCFSVVLECVPLEIAQMITEQLTIPTIGIGAGVYCDGQVLVIHDLLGLSSRQPKFVKQYADLNRMIAECVKQYQKDVLTGHFPNETQSYHILASELEKLKSGKIS